ncbi:MAG: sodium/solute symporter [Rhodospirillales bacterium]|nr:sodium/solute symporter [Rhodospirillales bacterium]
MAPGRMTGLTNADIFVIALYLGATFGFALWAARAGTRDAAGYFLAGRALPWYLIGFSYYASNMSGASFVGLIGASYVHGIVVFHYEWTAALVLALFAVFILPVFLRNRIFTAPEYLELRYDRRARWTYSLFTLVTLVLLDTAGALYAGAIVLRTAIPDLSLWAACTGLALLAGVYTIFGGLRAVVITDALQAVVMIVATLGLGLYGLWAVGGWENMLAAAGPARAELFRPPDDAFLPTPGIGGVILLGFYYWTFNQYFVQRALAARSVEDGRKGALFGGLLKLPNILFMVVPGLVAAALYPDLANPDQAFPVLTFDLLPVGLRAIVLAALLAAIMSSLDSALNAAASLVTMDFVKPLRPQTSDTALAAIGRTATTAIMVMAAIYAPLIAGFGGLFQYFQSTLAYLVPCVVAVYLGGLATRHIARGSAFWAMIVMLPAGLGLFLAKELSGLWAAAGLPDIHFTYMAMIMFAGTLAVMAGLSFVPALRRRAVADKATVRRIDFAPDPGRTGPRRDHRVLAAGLMALTALLLAVLAAS